MVDIPKNVALVYDRVNKWGGAEQVLLALHELFPQAPLYTSVYEPQAAGWAQVFPKVIPTFIQNLPFAKTNHELYPWLTPLGFETLDLRLYDAVISVTSADAKAVITRPRTFHLCYCLTPTRYLYSHPVVPWPVSSYLKTWDQVAATRPDAYMAISSVVQDRIKKYYGRDSLIVYPPVNIENFQNTKYVIQDTKYFLSVNRLVYHKEPEKLVALFNELGLPLVMVGTGRLHQKLKNIASSNVKIIGSVTETELVTYYNNAKAYVSVHEEDFGIAYVEAQAAGLPILALNRGGVKDIVSHGETGLLLDSVSDLKQNLKKFDPRQFNHLTIQQSSNRFSKTRFASEFVKVFKQQWQIYKNTYMS